MTTLYMNGLKINLAKLPTYVEFNGDWETPVDKVICDMILESDDPRLTPAMKTNFKKLADLVTPAGTLKHKYNPRLGKLGRRYPEQPSEQMYQNGEYVPNPLFGRYWGNLTIQAGLIKNTIFTFQGWVDYDQVKGHPTILYEVAMKGGHRLPAYENYLREGGFEEWCNELIPYYSADGEEPLTPKDIKDLVNKTIYGGGHRGWCKEITHDGLPDHELEKLAQKGKEPREMKNQDRPHPLYQRLLKDTVMITHMLYVSNPDLVAKIRGNLEDDTANDFSKLRNRFVSYYCGIIENHLTTLAYKYACENGLCPKRGVDWGYDGFTAPAPPPHSDMDFHIAGMNDFVREKSGFELVRFVMKPIPSDKRLDAVIQQRLNYAVAVPVVGELINDAVVINEPANGLPQEGQPVNPDDAPYLLWKQNFENVEGWTKIKNISCFLRVYKNEDGSFNKFVYLKEGDLRTAYNHECYTTTDENGKTKKIKMIAKWLDDPTMACKDDIDNYPPPLVCPANVFNIWSPFPFESEGFAHMPYVSEDQMGPDGQPLIIYPPDFDLEAVELWLAHLRIMCNNDDEVGTYLTNWIAHSIQHPAVKPECAITMTSEEGSGKNIIINGLADLYGHSKKLETSSPETCIWGAHNAPMANAYFVVLSEVDKRNAKGADGKIKALITDRTAMINPKGKDQFAVKSFHRIFLITNSADPTKTSKKDRRNLIIRCSDEKIGDRDYFNNLTAALARPHAMRSIFWLFKVRDLAGWNFRDIPRTDYHDIIIEGNRPPLEIFMEAFTWDNIQEPYVELLGNEMLQTFRVWREGSGHSFDDKISVESLIKRLLTEIKLLPDTIVKLPRSSAGIRRRYDIQLLKQRFGIGFLQVSQANQQASAVASAPQRKKVVVAKAPAGNIFRSAVKDNVVLQVAELDLDVETESEEECHTEDEIEDDTYDA